MAGPPIGSSNAAKARKFYDSMMRAASKDDWAQLRRIAQKALDAAEEGESWAQVLVRDTLDGKPAQVIAGDPDAPLTFKNLPVKLVAPE